jgi:hypothetical protein
MSFATLWSPEKWASTRERRETLLPTYSATLLSSKKV